MTRMIGLQHEVKCLITRTTAGNERERFGGRNFVKRGLFSFLFLTLMTYEKSSMKGLEQVKRRMGEKDRS